MTRTVADQMVETLAAAGVERIYGIVGDSLNGFTELRLAGLKAERTELYRIARSHKLSDETARKLVREIDLVEARFGTR
jgi:hypothetical protein